MLIVRPDRFYWKLINNTESKTRDVSDYVLDDDINYLDLITGKRLHGKWPGDIKLVLQRGNLPLSDYLANPLGLCVMSRRLVDALLPFFTDSVQLLEIPVYEPNGKTAHESFWIVNVLEAYDCVEKVGASLQYNEEDTPIGYTDPKFNSKLIPPGKHIFKHMEPDNMPGTEVFVSAELATSLDGKEFSGIAFMRIDTV